MALQDAYGGAKLKLLMARCVESGIPSAAHHTSNTQKNIIHTPTCVQSRRRTYHAGVQEGWRSWQLQGHGHSIQSTHPVQMMEQADVTRI